MDNDWQDTDVNFLNPDIMNKFTKTELEDISFYLELLLIFFKIPILLTEQKIVNHNVKMTVTYL